MSFNDCTLVCLFTCFCLLEFDCSVIWVLAHFPSDSIGNSFSWGISRIFFLHSQHNLMENFTKLYRFLSCTLYSIILNKGSMNLLTGVLASNDMKDVAPFCKVSVTNCGWISVLSWVGFEWPPYCPGWNSLLPFPSKARVAAFEGSNSLCSSRRLILLSARNF